LAFFLAIAVSLFAPINPAAIAEVKQPIINWSGFYIGANGGYLKAQTKYVNLATPVQELKGGLYGAQIGYNFQVKQLVLGVEADGSWGKLDTFIRDGNFLTENGKIDQFITVRGRIGYAFGNFLPYATAGRVWTRLEQGTACPAGALFGVCALTGPFNIQLKQTFTGWAYGGGVEYAFAKHWSVKGEALWTKLDDRTYSSSVPVVGIVSTSVGLSTSAVLRAGVNYRF
jgi:outer membrane immunogenic protein